MDAREPEGVDADDEPESLRHYVLGYDLAEAGDHAAAAPLFRAAAEAGDPDGWLALGNSLRELDRSAEAAEAFAAAADAGVDDALIGLALALEDEHDWTGAEAAYLRARVAGDPKAPTYLAHLWRWHGQPERARTLLREAAAAGDDQAANDLALWLRLDVRRGRGAQDGQDDDVEALLRQGAQADPDARSELAWVLRERGDVDGAEQLLRRGVADGHLDSSIKLAIVLEEDRGDAEAAERVLREAAAAGELFAWTNLGVLLVDRGRLQEARSAFRTGATGGDDLAVRWLRRLRRDHRRQLGREVRRHRRALRLGRG